MKLLSAVKTSKNHSDTPVCVATMRENMWLSLQMTLMFAKQNLYILIQSLQAGRTFNDIALSDLCYT